MRSVIIAKSASPLLTICAMAEGAALFDGQIDFRVVLTNSATILGKA